MKTWFDVEPINEATVTEAAKRFRKAVKALDDLPGELERMHANISTAACRATGYCNIGCGYGAKLSTLDTVLPRAQHEHGLELMADVRVDKIERQGRRATRVIGRHGPTGQRVEVEADEIVIAAGPIGSSYLLQRSGLGGDAVGRDLHFNINSPLTADFPDEVDSFARDPDVARLPLLGRRPALPGRDLVQPARHPGARHARLVRPPLRQHAALPAHGVLRRAGRDHRRRAA